MELSQESKNIPNGDSDKLQKIRVKIRIQNHKKKTQISRIEMKNRICSLVSKIGTLMSLICLYAGALITTTLGFTAFFGLLNITTSVLSIYFLHKMFKMKLKEQEKNNQPKGPVYIVFITLFIINALLITSVFFASPIITVIALSLMSFILVLNTVRMIKEHMEQRHLKKEVEKKEIKKLCVAITCTALSLCVVSLAIASCFILPTLPIEIALVTMLIIVSAFDLVGVVNLYKKSKLLLNSDPDIKINYEKSDADNDQSKNKLELGEQDIEIPIDVNLSDNEAEQILLELNLVDGNQGSESALEELESENVDSNSEKKILQKGYKQGVIQHLLSPVIKPDVSKGM